MLQTARGMLQTLAAGPMLGESTRDPPMTRTAQIVRLTLTSNVVDVWRAATQCADFAEFIAQRDGFEVSVIGSYHALLDVRPWATVGIEAAPWRVIRAAMARLGY